LNKKQIRSKIGQFLVECINTEKKNGTEDPVGVCILKWKENRRKIYATDRRS